MGLSKESIVNCLRESYGESVTSAEIKAFCQMNDFNYQTITNKLTDYKVGRGKWNLEVTKETVEELEVTYNSPAAMPAIEQNLIPAKDDSFVQFGNFTDIKKIIKSRYFYPTFITGLSGNGKTFSKEKEFSSRRLANGLRPQRVSKYSQQPTPKVKVATTDDSLELTCSTKRSLSDSL
jgi:hypothetical protein